MMTGSSLTLQSASATHDQVKTAGLSLMKAVYGGTDADSLAAMRYAAYCTMSLARRFQTERLPPSDDATQQHALRAHYQCVVWCCPDNADIHPINWGWKILNSRVCNQQKRFSLIETEDIGRC
jgi:hypothetical protein